MTRPPLDLEAIRQRKAQQKGRLYSDDAEALLREIARLRRIAIGQDRHRYSGHCPESLNDWADRDPSCPACKVLRATDGER